MSNTELVEMLDRATAALRAALPADAEHMLLLALAAEAVLAERRCAGERDAPTVH